MPMQYEALPVGQTSAQLKPQLHACTAAHWHGVVSNAPHLLQRYAPPGGTGAQGRHCPACVPQGAGAVCMQVCQERSAHERQQLWWERGPVGLGLHYKTQGRWQTVSGSGGERRRRRRRGR